MILHSRPNNNPVLLIILIPFLTKYVSSFIAFSCNGHKLNITSFNALTVDYCQSPPPSKVVKIPSIKLLQRTESHTIPFKACYILADYFISKCSTFDDAQMVRGGFFSEIIDISPIQCSDIHHRQIYQINNNAIISNIKINQTKYFSATIAGNISPDGNCQGSSFSNSNENWDNVVVQAKYKLYISDGIGIVNYKDDIFISPSGTRFKFTNFHGIDTILGNINWDNFEPQAENCNTHEFDVLYEGPANLVISKNNDNEETHTYIVQSDKIIFALKKSGLSYACSIPTIATQHPRLLILTDPLYFSNFKAQPISNYNTDLMAYVNSKFVYIENFLSSSITDMYRDLTMKQCNLERQILLQKLAIASYSLSEFAYVMSGSPGYASLKSGEIIYLLKCKPVEVQLAKSENCFNELPVIFENTTKYLSPKNHILLNHGTEIDCSELMPSAYFIENTWFSLSPHYREINPPQTLLPETSFTWSYKSPEFLMNAGLYSKEMMNSFQKQLLFPQEINIAQNLLARETLGYKIHDQGLRIKSFIDNYTIDKIVEDKLQKIYGWFLWFGNCISGFLGLFFITKLILTCLNTFVNFSILYNTFGMSFKLLAGLCSSFTHFLMHKKHSKNYFKTQNTETISTAPFLDEKENINSIKFQTNNKPYNVHFSNNPNFNEIYPTLHHQSNQHYRKPSL